MAIKHILLVAIACMSLFSGCNVSHNGSQGLTFNPFNFGSRDPVLAPTNDYRYMEGERMDYRR